jgi:(p)ppGpp synthase/HD superfamily hydrolase
MNRKEFFGIMHREYGIEPLSLISETYQITKAIHRLQRREDGVRYFDHVRAVAIILACDFPPSSPRESCASLFHDGPEDQYILPCTIMKICGPEVASDVMLLTKYNIRLELDGGITKTKKDMRRYWAKISSGSREARRVKCADRLHNLLTMEAMPASHIWKKIAETRKYVLPIARATDDRMYLAIQNRIDSLEALIAIGIS